MNYMNYKEEVKEVIDDAIKGMIALYETESHSRKNLNPDGSVSIKATAIVDDDNVREYKITIERLK